MGIHSFHPFSITDTQTEDMTEARRDMWLWAEPVIADCAADVYDRSLPNRLASNIMARKHCRLWRAVIHDQADTVAELEVDLRRTSEKFGLDATLRHEVNTILFEELVDIVLSRYRGSRRKTKAFSRLLISARSCLGPARAAA